MRGLTNDEYEVLKGTYANTIHELGTDSHKKLYLIALELENMKLYARRNENENDIIIFSRTALGNKALRVEEACRLAGVV